MSRVNNKWEDEESWTFHVKNKDIIRDVLSTEDDEALKKLADLEWNDKWITNEGEGDPPNMEFIRRLYAAWWQSAEKRGIPPFERIWLERSAKELMSLFRQDSAYSERFGGFIQWFIWNERAWRKARNKKQRLEILKDCMAWWNDNDTRERTRGWITFAWNKALKWYDKKTFWEHSINFMIFYILDHKDEWKSHEMYDPKLWFPKGRGGINVLIHGGIA